MLKGEYSFPILFFSIFSARIYVSLYRKFFGGLKSDLLVATMQLLKKAGKGYPVFLPYGNSYWFIPNEQVEPEDLVLLETNGIDFIETEEGIVVNDLLGLKKLEAIYDFSNKVVSNQEGAEPSLIGGNKQVLLRFLIEYGKREWSYYLDSYGCAQNQAEGSNLDVFLQRVGGNKVKDPKLAEIRVINSCAVKKPTEDRMIRIARQSSKESQLVIMSGCLPLINPGRIHSLGDNIRLASPNPIPSILETMIDPEKLKTSRREISSIPLLEPVFHDRNKLSAIFPVGQGCVGACTFCAVKFARGFIKSYPADLIVRLAKRAIERGAKEIWLTGQDTAAYGLDKKRARLPELVRSIAELKGDFKIRIGMMSPDTAIPIIDEIIDLLQNPRVYRFLHLPVQSGSDTVLKAMNRYYTVDEYRSLVKKLRSALPDLTLMTDIIIGFPGETEEDHNETINLLREIRFDVVNVSRYMDRPGTKAKKMKNKLPTQIVKARSIEASEIVRQESLKRNQYWLGWKGEATVVASVADKDFIARNYAYKPIVVKQGSLGETVKVSIVHVSDTSLFAEKPLPILPKKRS